MEIVPGEIRSIVIPLLAGVGNSIMAMPMIRQLKRALPKAHITILARYGPYGEPLRRMPEVDEVLITGVGIKALFRATKWTRKRKPDLYLVPFPSNRWQYGLLLLTSGAKYKLLHSYPVAYFWSMQFIGTRIPAERGLHEVVQNLRLLNVLGIEPDESEIPKFNLTDADRERADTLLQSAGLAPGVPFIALHAGSGITALSQAKRWP